MSEKSSKDLFSQVNNTLVSIQKSKSNADLKLNQEIPDIPKPESKKDILGGHLGFLSAAILNFLCNFPVAIFM